MSSGGVRGCRDLQAKIGPSILNADLSRLSEECQRLVIAGADYLHLDVMDGHFVPPITFGHQMVEALRKTSSLAKGACFFDMHMMVANPDKFVSPMAEAGADQFVFHYEAAEEVGKTIRKVREAGMRVGIAVKPNTDVEVVVPFIEQLDLVLIMTVEPGAGGQKFMEPMMTKVESLRKRFAELDIEVDGGVSPDTISDCANAGANLIVSGTAVIKSKDPKQTMDQLRKAIQEKIPYWKWDNL